MLDNMSWIAGLLEGEGSFVLNGTRPRVICSMTDKDVIEKLRDSVGSGTIIVRDRYKGPDGTPRKTQWYFSVSGDAAMDLMYKLYDYMGVRRKAQIAYVIETQMNKQERNKMKKELVDHAVYLIKTEGFTIKRAAEVTCCNVTTVRSRLYGLNQSMYDRVKSRKTGVVSELD